MSDLATKYNIAKSMTKTFHKNNESINPADVAKRVTTVHSKQRPQKMNEVEKQLLTWIKELIGDSISEGIICEALQIYIDHLKKTPSTVEGECGFTFKGSSGWFFIFKHRSAIHSVARHGDAVSSNKQLKNMLANFVITLMQKAISPSLAVTRLAYSWEEKNT